MYVCIYTSFSKVMVGKHLSFCWLHVWAFAALSKNIEAHLIHFEYRFCGSSKVLFFFWKKPLSVSTLDG